MADPAVLPTMSSPEQTESAEKIAAEIVAGMVCRACGAVLPNENCGQAKNARDYSKPAPCSPAIDIEYAIAAAIQSERASADRRVEEALERAAKAGALKQNGDTT